MLVKSQVKYIQSLSQKKFRDSEGLFIAEGPKIINELLHAPNIKTTALFALQEWLDENSALLATLPPETRITVIEESELPRISLQTTPKQVLGIFHRPIFTAQIFSNHISLVLDNIQDPGNMGTIVRTADWFGVQHIICSEASADVFNPKTVQSTMGSISRVDVMYTNLEKFLIAHAEIPAYAATLDGTDLYKMGRIKNGFLIIGSESKGISAEILQLVQHRITIPRKGHAESLNAAVATGIILSGMSYEV